MPHSNDSTQKLPPTAKEPGALTPLAAKGGLACQLSPPPTHEGRRSIRSYVLRTGRLTPAQAQAISRAPAALLLPFDPDVGDLVAACKGRFTACVLEIGFGMGGATATIAARHPDTLYIGCEVHSPGVGALLRLIQDRELPNVRIVQHDACEVLAQMCAPCSLDGLHIFFPDPWPKKRHHKRRLIEPGFVKLASSRLKLGGYIHLATDWQPYAQVMLETLSGESSLVNCANTASGGYANSAQGRATTKFEERGLGLGHGVWDLIFARKS